MRAASVPGVLKEPSIFRYVAFGLGIHSDLPLPELVASDLPCDVTIQMDEALKDGSSICGPSRWEKISRQEAVLRLEEVGVITLGQGRQITVKIAPGARESRLRLFLEGTVMAILLYQRGLLALHASCVSIGRRAVAFLAESGLGKSSLAGALCSRGHTLIADDLTAVELGESSAKVFFGFPQLKIDPEVAAMLGKNPESLLPLDLDEPKQGWRFPCQLPLPPVPLDRIYILADDDIQRIEAISPRERILELVRHTYPTRLRLHSDEAHFMSCSRLAQAVPMYRLHRPGQLSGLPDLAALVENHLAREEGTVSI